MIFVWIAAAVLMLFNTVYCAVKIRDDFGHGRQNWAATGLFGLLGVALAFGAIIMAFDHALRDMAVEALKNFD